MKINTALWPWIIAGSVLVLAMYTISGIFLPFLMGLLIAYAMHPIVTRITSCGIRRSLVSFVMVMSFFIIIVTTLFVAIPFIARELFILAGALPGYMKHFINFFTPHLESISSIIGSDNLLDLQTKASSYVGNVFSWGLNFMGRLLTNTLALANLITLIVITPVVAFYLLRDWLLMIEHAKGLLPRQQAPTILDLATQINNTLGAYVRGQSLVCLILAFIYSVGLWLVGLDYAFTVGLVTGLLSFIPFVGVLVGVFSGLGIAFSQFDSWVPIVMVSGVFGIGSLIEGQLLSPNLVGGRIGLHPVWVIFALLAGGSSLGFIGMLLALPTAAIIGVLVRYSISRYKESSLYYGENSIKKQK